MADGSALIAALRSATPVDLKQASGPQTLSFPWMARTEGPLVLPTRKSAKPTPVTPVTPSPVQPVEPIIPDVIDSIPVITKPIEPVYTPPTDTSVGNYGVETKPMQQTDWDKLNADYASAYNQAMQQGLSPEQWSQTPVFGNWQKTVLSGVEKTSDPTKLTGDINWLSSNINDPVYGDWYQTLLSAEQQKLNQLYPQNYDYFE